jgi:hypothetical protein
MSGNAATRYFIISFSDFFRQTVGGLADDSTLSISVCKKMAHYIGMSIASSKDTDEFTYLRYAVLLRKGGERDPAQLPGHLYDIWLLFSLL